MFQAYYAATVLVLLFCKTECKLGNVTEVCTLTCSMYCTHHITAVQKGECGRQAQKLDYAVPTVILQNLTKHCMFCKFTCTTLARMRILSGWSEWAFITPRPLKNKLELPFDEDQDEENGLNRMVLII